MSIRTKFVAALAIGIMSLGITSCGEDSSSSVPSTAPSIPETLQTMSPDKAIELLRERQPKFKDFSDSDIRVSFYTICADLDSGNDFSSVIDSGITSGFTANEVGAQIESAVMSICPRHLQALNDYITRYL